MKIPRIAKVGLADADRIFKENSKAVVMVTAYDEEGNTIGHGSGFIVRQDGAVVTNYHVIGMAKDIKVKAGDKVFDVEGLIYIDKENDLVILKAKAKGMPVVKLGVIEKANIGERVYVIGYPSGRENTISVGLLSGIKKIDKREILWVIAPLSLGNSGGPVFNRNGEVIGVATTAVTSGTRPFCIAMPVELIKDKISSKMVTAIKELRLEDYLNTAMFWNSLGGTHERSGKDLGALEAYKQAIRVDPYDVFGHFNLGGTYARLGEHKEAIEAYKQAIRVVPDFAEAHFVLGFLYADSGMYKESIESYKQAIRSDPDFADAHYNLGLIYGKSSMYNNEAIESYKQAIRSDPDLAVAHYHLGVIYGKSSMWKEAIESYKQAIRIVPDLVVAHLNLCFAYHLSNDRDSALEQYKILKSLDTEKANELFNLIYE